MSGARIFMKEAALPGQSETATFKGQVVLTNISFGESNHINFHAGASGSNNVFVHNISCTKQVDGATPTLSRACVQALSLATVTLTVTRPPSANSTEPYTFAVITLKDAVVTSHMVSMSGEDSNEVFSLHFATIAMKITPQDEKGNKMADGTYNYNVRTQVATGS